MNPAVRRTVTSVAKDVNASFVYQRHERFLTAGVDVARSLKLPLVLEWNSSQAWTQEHWSRSPGWIRAPFRSTLLMAERYVAARASVIAAASTAARAMALEAGAPAANVITVPNAADIDALDRAVAAGQVPHLDGPLIGWVGSFGRWHGADVLLRALTGLPEQVRVLMIGDGVERTACEDLSAKLGVAGRVVWAGQLPHQDAVHALSRCDILAMPNVPLEDGQPFFGSPTKLFEFMTLGRPIVASRLGQIAEVLEDGRTARLVAPGDAGQLAQAIGEVLDSADAGEALATAARAEVERSHTWRQRTDSVLAALGSSD